jgi:TetR/AcrR family transcriptional regulator, cholesterol catabolism regulator
VSQDVSTVSSLTHEGLGSDAQRARHTRILDATIALASLGGFDAVQMRAVAERADVALGTLYRYFPSKIHLLVSALAREFEQAALTIGHKPIPGDDQADRVMFVLGRATATLQRDPHLTEALTRAFMFADASVQAESRAVGRLTTRMLTRAMREPGRDPEREPGREPGRAPAQEPVLSDEDTAIAQVLADVWFSGLVGWVTGRSSADEVVTQLEVAVRLLLR